MPSLSQSRKHKGVLSANPLVSPLSARKQVNLHNRGSQELTPTTESSVGRKKLSASLRIYNAGLET